MAQTPIIPVSKFLFHADLPVFGDVLKAGFTVEEHFDSEKLLTALSTQSAGLVIASLRDKKDLLEIASLVKRMKVVAKDTTIKIVAVNISGDRNFEKAAMKLGIQDLIEPGINARALKFKIDFWMKSLAAQIKNAPNLIQKTTKSQETKNSEPASTDAKEAEWLGPMELESDIWVLKNDHDCKKVLNKWLVKILGPSPYVSEWKEVKNGLWELSIKDSMKEMLVSESGSWFYRGSQKPDFLWNENLWLFTGENYELFFKDDLGIKSRFKSEHNKMTITKNSLFAKTKEPLLIESCDKNLLIKKESDHLDNLEGKGDVSDHLKGHLAGDVENQESKKASHWNTKSSFKEKESPALYAPNQNEIKTGKNLELDNDHKNHETFYKNHNEATQYEAKDLSGKSSTENLGGKPLELKPTNTNIDKFYKNGSASSQDDSRNADETSPLDPLREGKTLALKPGNTNLEKYYKNGSENPSEKESHEKQDNVLTLMTSDSKVYSHMRINQKRVECDFNDFFDETIIFLTATEEKIDLPSSVNFNVSFSYMGETSKLELEGEVSEVESDGEGKSFVTVKLSPFNAQKTSQFMEKFEKRQKNVHDFLKMAKGF